MKIAHAGARAVVVPRTVSMYLGPTAGIYEWPPRRVGGLHSAFSLVTPPVGARGTFTNRPLGRVGLGGAAGCVPFSGANRWLCKSPAREAGRLDCLIFARRPAGGCVRNLCRLPTRALALLWYRGLCPCIWGRPLGFTSGRHARWAVFFENFDLSLSS